MAFRARIVSFLLMAKQSSHIFPFSLFLSVSLSPRPLPFCSSFPFSFFLSFHRFCHIHILATAIVCLVNSAFFSQANCFFFLILKDISRVEERDVLSIVVSMVARIRICPSRAAFSLFYFILFYFILFFFFW